MTCLPIISITLAHVFINGVDQGRGAEFIRQDCFSHELVINQQPVETYPPILIRPVDQTVYVRSPQEIEFEAKRILAMKVDGLGVPIDKLKKCYVIENNQRRWHMWEKCK